MKSLSLLAGRTVVIISKPFRFINIALMTADNAYPFELMHSVVSRIYVPCLIMSHLMGTLYKC